MSKEEDYKKKTAFINENLRKAEKQIISSLCTDTTTPIEQAKLIEAYARLIQAVVQLTLSRQVRLLDTVDVSGMDPGPTVGGEA